MYASLGALATRTSGGSGVISADLAQKIGLAFLSAILGFGFALFLDWLRRRREPHAQISWEGETSQGLLSIKEEVRQRVQVLYDRRQVGGLFAVTCRLVNTGNQVIRKHSFRFVFPAESKILEGYCDPIPEPELGLVEVTDESLPITQRKYTIVQFPRESELSFKFLVDSKERPIWIIHSFSEESDVQFQSREAGRSREDVEQLRPFLVLLFLFLVIPPLLAKMPDELGTLASASAQIVFIAGLSFYLRPVSKILAILIVNVLKRAGSVFNIDARGAQGMQVGDTNEQANRWAGQRSST